MKYFQILSILCVFYFLHQSPAYARDNLCASLALNLPDLEIINAENSITYNFNYTRKQLTQLQKGDLSARLEQSAPYYMLSDLYLTGSNLGLTVGVYKYQLLILPDLKRVGAEGRHFCPHIKKVVIRFIYESTIFVAKEYPVNGCGFNKIMEHEIGHHNVYVRNKKKYLGWLQNDLQAITNQIVKKYPPVKEDQVEKRFKRLRYDLEDAIDAYIFRMQLDANRYNQKLDTPSEYLKMNRAVKRCYEESERLKQQAKNKQRVINE